VQTINANNKNKMATNIQGNKYFNVTMLEVKCLEWSPCNTYLKTCLYIGAGLCFIFTWRCKWLDLTYAFSQPGTSHLNGRCMRRDNDQPDFKWCHWYATENSVQYYIFM